MTMRTLIARTEDASHEGRITYPAVFSFARSMLICIWSEHQSFTGDPRYTSLKGEHLCADDEAETLLRNPRRSGR